MQQNIFRLRLRVLNDLRQHGLCKPHDTLIVAVSGGSDSVALLDILANLPDFPLSLVAAHLNHCLRGTESDHDEQFVRELTESYSLPLEVKRVDIRDLARQKSLSLEEAGREARYRFFNELRQLHGAAAIAVAHHSDDQAETLLIRLLRGSGIDGLGCMSYCNNRGIIRPLLNTDKAELKLYLEQQGKVWREDKSNQDQSILRNRVRHELLPLLADYTPTVINRLAATAMLIRQDHELLQEYASDTFRRLAHQTKDGILFKNECMNQLSGMRYRLYRMAIETIAGDLRCFELEHIRQIDRLLAEGRTGAAVMLPQNMTALRTADGLIISSRDILVMVSPADTIINGPGSYDLDNGLSLTVQKISSPTPPCSYPNNTALVDLSAAPFPWLARPHRPGDRITLSNGSGSRGTGRILIDLKIPRHLRPMLPLLLAGDKPLWLVGAKRSGHARVSPQSTNVVGITVQGLENLICFPPSN